MSDARYPRSTRTASISTSPRSTDIGLTTAGLDMSSDERRVTRSVYVAVLSKDEPSPLAPESDEEKGAQGDEQERKGRQVRQTTKDDRQKTRKGSRRSRWS